MRHNGKYLRLAAKPYPRGISVEGAIRDHAKKMRRLRYRLARKNAALRALSLWWNGKDEEALDDPSKIFELIDPALSV